MTLKETLVKDSVVDWDIFVSRHNEVPPLFVYLNISSHYPKKWFFAKTGIDFAFRYQKRVGDVWFWSVRDREKLKKILNQRADLDRNYLKGVVEHLQKRCHELQNWCLLHGRKKSYSEMDNSELLGYFEKYWEKLRGAASFLLAKHVLNRVLEERIRKKLQNDPIFQKLLIPSKDTLIGEANKKLIAIFKNKPKTKDLQKWLARYDWIDTFYWSGKILKKEDLIRKAKNIPEQRRAIHKASFGLEVRTLQDLLYLHTYELECIFASKYWCRDLLKPIAERIGLSFNDYQYATYPEIIAALKGQLIDRPKVLKRKGNRFAAFRFGNQISFFEGDEFKKITASASSATKSMRDSKVIGTAAYLGLVRGKARVIRTVKELTKLAKNDILITPMTTIDFTPFLGKAKAIVTDEGGITCHASIISRELGIPCVIGTKVATRVFKDGDLVEVDANKGVVRKVG